MVCNTNGPMDDLSVTLLGMFQRGRFSLGFIWMSGVCVWRIRVWGCVEDGWGCDGVGCIERWVFEEWGCGLLVE